MKSVIVSLLIVVSLALVNPSDALGDPASPPPSHPATPTPSSPAPAPIINLIFHWDFGVIGEAVQKALQDVFGGIATGIQQHLFAPIAESSLNILTQTPPSGTYANATVVALWGYTRDVASLGFVVIVVLCGYQVMVGRATATPFADALATLGNAILGLLLANTSLWWAGLAIDLGNGLTGGIGAVSLPDIASTGFAGSAIETIFLGLVYLIMGILLVLQMLLRLALLDILLILAPLAVLVGVLPWGRHWGRLWADLFVGTLIAQFAQILVLRLGTGLMTQLVPSLSSASSEVNGGMRRGQAHDGDILRLCAGDQETIRPVGPSIVVRSCLYVGSGCAGLPTATQVPGGPDRCSRHSPSRAQLFAEVPPLWATAAQFCLIWRDSTGHLPWLSRLVLRFTASPPPSPESLPGPPSCPRSKRCPRIVQLVSV